MSKQIKFTFGLATYLILIMVLGLVAPAAQSQKPAKQKEGEKINWLSFEEAVAKQKENPKKIFIDVYTDWCGWCKKMDKDAFSKAEVAAYVNQNFYAVKLDAEGKEPITVNGRTYTYKPEHRSHELAIALLQGQMSYPTTVYLDEKLNMLSPVPGYLTADMFTKILRYYGENHFKNTKWDEYEAKK